MKCNEIKDWMIDYIDNPSLLEEKLRNEIESHLNSCVACAAEYKQVKELNTKMLQIEMVEESEQFRNKFISRLEKEKASYKRKTVSFKLNRNLVNIAASILLLITGTLIGYFIAKNNKVSKLEDEIMSLKYLYTSSVLSYQTASVRLKAINFVDEDKSINPDLIPILGNILNNDENVNVRLAAANALFKYNYLNEVNRLLIESLQTQTEPVVQIALINFLVDNHEKRAVENLKVLLKRENTNNIVKQYVNHGLKVLL
jgi:hypothetical protein